MFGSDIWNASASLRQYPDSATGMPAPAASRQPVLPNEVSREKYFKKALKSGRGLP
ncbi:hypothetical protein P0D72_29580 [Paraburkholderia sediminicola]|uniref:hypothetical protein n=1 Tax=Paraburkholderia sediminicola TaxID=458836 RepID=UPI0038B6C747